MLFDYIFLPLTSYLKECTWCDVVKEGYSHQYNFIRITLKVFIHIHDVTLLFNLPLVNYFYLGTTLLSRIKKITIHFLWPHTHNCTPGSFYFEFTTLDKGLSLTFKADWPPLSRPAPDLFTSPLLWPCKTLLPPNSPWHGVPNAANTSTDFLFSTNLRLHVYRQWRYQRL